VPRSTIAPLGLTTEGGLKFKLKGWKCYIKRLQCEGDTASDATAIAASQRWCALMSVPLLSHLLPSPTIFPPRKPSFNPTSKIKFCVVKSEMLLTIKILNQKTLFFTFFRKKTIFTPPKTYTVCNRECWESFRSLKELMIFSQLAILLNGILYLNKYLFLKF